MLIDSWFFYFLTLTKLYSISQGCIHFTEKIFTFISVVFKIHFTDQNRLLIAFESVSHQNKKKILTFQHKTQTSHVNKTISFRIEFVSTLYILNVSHSHWLERAQYNSCFKISHKCREQYFFNVYRSKCKGLLKCERRVWKKKTFSWHFDCENESIWLMTEKALWKEKQREKFLFSMKCRSKEERSIGSIGVHSV